MTAWSNRQYRNNKTIALVPTMGYLHEGHLSLVRLAKKHADLVVVSIYVNPTQFGPTEDFSRYPRNIKRDLKLLKEEGTDVVFTPSNMYESKIFFSINPGSLQNELCGKFRPGHFEGVATIVLKLFNVIQPQVAVFGQKDAQQFAILKKMTKELDLDIKMIAAPIVREPDGLAMSSRNVYLSSGERHSVAPTLNTALRFIQDAFGKGNTHAPLLLKKAAQIPKGKLQYLAAVDPETLLPVKKLVPGTLVAGAMFAGKTRLIDNITL